MLNQHCLGARSTLRLRAECKGTIMLFSIPLENLMASGDEVFKTESQYLETWSQLVREGVMSFWDSALSTMRSIVILPKVVGIIEQLEEEIEKLEGEHRVRKGKTSKRSRGMGQE